MSPPVPPHPGKATPGPTLTAAPQRVTLPVSGFAAPAVASSLGSGEGRNLYVRVRGHRGCARTVNPPHARPRPWDHHPSCTGRGQVHVAEGPGSHVCAQPRDSVRGMSVEGLHGPRLHVDEGSLHSPSLRARVHEESAHGLQLQMPRKTCGIWGPRPHTQGRRVAQGPQPRLAQRGGDEPVHGEGSHTPGTPATAGASSPQNPHLCLAQPWLRLPTCTSTRTLEPMGMCWSPRDVSNPMGRARAPRECA